MKNRLYVVGGVLLVAALGGLVWWSPWEPREPIYQGKPLSSWLLMAANGNRESQELGRAAVRQAGTNALPTLLRMLRVKDSPSRRGVELRRLARDLNIVRFPFAVQWNNAGLFGFQVLGEEAKNAVPGLMEIANESTSHTSIDCVMIVFDIIGPPAKEAVPFLLRCSTNADRMVRYRAINALGRIHAEPDRVVPVLVNELRDPNSGLAFEVTQALGEFGADARSAVPALVEFLNKQDEQGKKFVVDALNQIDPEAAAKAGVKKPSP